MPRCVIFRKRRSKIGKLINQNPKLKVACWLKTLHHSIWSITENWRKKPKSLNWNCIRLEFEKNNSLQKSCQKLCVYEVLYSLSSSRPFKDPGNSISFELMENFFCGMADTHKTLSQLAYICSRLTIETLEQGVKYVQC